MTTPLQRVTDPAFVEDLSADDIAVVRQKRQECQDLENAMSYVRRLLHGRLDIVRSELERRQAGEDPADLEAIIARLPDMLSDGSRSDALPRPPQDLAPDSFAESLVADLEDRFPASVMSKLPDMDAGQLDGLVVELRAYEAGVSDGRGSLHRVIDALQDEIIRRYQSGTADVDSLLQ